MLHLLSVNRAVPSFSKWLDISCIDGARVTLCLVVYLLRYKLIYVECLCVSFITRFLGLRRYIWMFVFSCSFAWSTLLELVQDGTFVNFSSTCYYFAESLTDLLGRSAHSLPQFLVHMAISRERHISHHTPIPTGWHIHELQLHVLLFCRKPHRSAR